MKCVIASSHSLKELEGLINEFYVSNELVVDKKTLTNRNRKTGRIGEGMRIVRKGNRYRFEIFS